MIIKSLTLTNFRQYRGVQTIEFSTDPDKNVTVILGVNTSGKTTLVQAFLWCLYNTTNFNNKQILNVELAQSLMPYATAEAGVKIVLIHEGREFIFSKMQKFVADEFHSVRADGKASLSVSYKDETGNSIPIAPFEHENTINKILPQDLSDYFFFDGERIEEINAKKNVSAAVRGLMGLDIVNSAVDHLSPDKASSVISQLTKGLDLGKDQRSSWLKEQQEKEETQLEAYKKRLQEVEEEIEYYKREKEHLREQLLATQEVRDKQKEKQTLESDLKIIQANIKQADERILQDFNKEYLSFFATPLIQKAKNVLACAKMDVKGIPEMHAKSIDYILERGRCICGCDLTKNQGAVEHIQVERSLLPPQHIGTLVRHYSETCDQFLRRADGVAKTIAQDWINLCRQNRQWNDKSAQLDKVSDEIIKLGSVNAAQMEQDYRSYERMLSDKNQLKGRIESNIAHSKAEIEKYKKEISGLVVQNEKNELIRKEIAYTTAVYRWFKKSYDEQVKEVRDNLTESINKIFEKMYHGQRKVEIDENYRMKLLTTVDDRTVSTDESKGLEAVKNFSFISGLVDLARRRAREKQESPDELDKLFATEPYPIVMDAPFSNVDEIHIGNISMILPSIAEQVILIVMKKDWQHAKSTMEGKVGASYYIEKVDNSDTHSQIRRGDNV